MRPLKIGDVARRAGVSVDTVRFYERVGVLPAADRRPSGYRVYDESVLTPLTYIRVAKGLGFTLPEIRDMVRLSFGEWRACDHVRQLAERKLADVEEKLRQHGRMRRTLKRVIGRCERHDGVDCPLFGKSTVE